jgi:hypothetical protein
VSETLHCNYPVRLRRCDLSVERRREGCLPLPIPPVTRTPDLPYGRQVMRCRISRRFRADDQMVAYRKGRLPHARICFDPPSRLPGDRVEGGVRSPNLHHHMGIAVLEIFEGPVHGDRPIQEKVCIPVVRVNRVACQGKSAYIHHSADRRDDEQDARRQSPACRPGRPAAATARCRQAAPRAIVASRSW